MTTYAKSGITALLALALVGLSSPPDSPRWVERRGGAAAEHRA
jgi:hypothetical protein